MILGILLKRFINKIRKTCKKSNLFQFAKNLAKKNVSDLICIKCSEKYSIQHNFPDTFAEKRKYFNFHKI